MASDLSVALNPSITINLMQGIASKAAEENHTTVQVTEIDRISFTVFLNLSTPSETDQKDSQDDEVTNSICNDIWQIVLEYAGAHTRSILIRINPLMRSLILKQDLQNQLNNAKGCEPFVSHMVQSLEKQTKFKCEKEIESLKGILSSCQEVDRLVVPKRFSEMDYQGIARKRDDLKERLLSVITSMCKEAKDHLEPVVNKYFTKEKSADSPQSVEDAKKDSKPTVEDGPNETTESVKIAKPDFIRRVFLIEQIRVLFFESYTFQRKYIWRDLESEQKVIKQLFSCEEFAVAEKWMEALTWVKRTDRFGMLVDQYLENGFPEKALEFVNGKRLDYLARLQLEGKIISWHVSKGNSYAWELLKPPKTFSSKIDEPILLKKFKESLKKLCEKYKFEEATDQVEKFVSENMDPTCEHSHGIPKISKESLHHFLLDFIYELMYRLRDIIKKINSSSVPSNQKVSLDKQYEKYTSRAVGFLTMIPDNERKSNLIFIYKDDSHFKKAMHKRNPFWEEEFDCLRNRFVNRFQVALIFLREKDYIRAFEVANFFVKNIYIFGFLDALLDDRNLDKTIIDQMLEMVDKLYPVFRHLLSLQAEVKGQKELAKSILSKCDVEALMKEAETKCVIILAEQGFRHLTDSLLSQEEYDEAGYRKVFLIGRAIDLTKELQRAEDSLGFLDIRKSMKIDDLKKWTRVLHEGLNSWKIEEEHSQLPFVYQAKIYDIKDAISKWFFGSNGPAYSRRYNIESFCKDFERDLTEANLKSVETAKKELFQLALVPENDTRIKPEERKKLKFLALMRIRLLGFDEGLEEVKLNVLIKIHYSNPNELFTACCLE